MALLESPEGRALFLLLLMATSRTQTETIDPQQFARLVRGLHADIQDVTFVYEGVQTYNQAEKPDLHHQGVYSFRNDGATLLDAFKQSKRIDSSVVRDVAALIGGTLTRAIHIPDQGQTGQTSIRGGPGSLDWQVSPERVVRLWHLRSLEDPADYGYSYQGWEEVGDRHCLRIHLSTRPIAQAADRPEDERLTTRLWIDMDRGGHPLKIEHYRGSKLFLRTHKVLLADFDAGQGRKIWFPVAGTTEVFQDVGADFQFRFHDRPVTTETFMVGAGTVRFNQGLSDDYFSVDRIAEDKGDPKLAALQREFAAQEPPPQESVRVDAESVRKRLEEQLELANRQSDMLRASSKAQAIGHGVVALRLALALGGIAILGTAIYWRSRWR